MRAKSTVKRRRIVDLPETTIRTIQTKLLRGKKLSEIADKTKTSYYVVNTIRTKMIESGLIKTKKSLKMTSSQATLFPQISGKTLNNKYTKLIVNNTEVNIYKAKSIVVDLDGVKINY